MGMRRDIRVEIVDHWQSIYDEDGEYMDGLTREIIPPIATEYTWDQDAYGSSVSDDDYPSPVMFAVGIALRLGVTEPNVYPVPDELREHNWLSMTTAHDTSPETYTETSIWLLGDWTPAERAEVFKKVGKYN